MRLYLFSNKALLTAGFNKTAVTVFENATDSGANGVLTFDDIAVDITGGHGDLPDIPTGNRVVNFTDNNGKNYHVGVVYIDLEKPMPVVKSLYSEDTLAEEASIVAYLLTEITRLNDELIDLRGKVEYQGLEFLTGKGE